MSIANVVKKVVGAPLGAAASIGRGLASQVIPGAYAPPAQPSGVLDPVAPNPEADEMPDFTLPELDPNDPDFADKQAIHTAYSELARRFEESSAADNIDYRAKYKEMADYIASKPEPKRWSPLSSFAIGMGNPAALDQVTADRIAAEKLREKREEEIANIQEQAIKGEIAQLMEKKNFRRALTQSKLLADLEATREGNKRRTEHTNKLAEIEAANKGKEAVARIKAASAEKTVNERTQMMITRYKLNAAQSQQLMKMAGSFVNGLQRQVDAAGEPYYDAQEVESILYRLVDWADDQDIEEPGVAGTKPAAPAKTAAPVGAATTGNGLKGSEEARAKFAEKRAGRAAAQKP